MKLWQTETDKKSLLLNGSVLETSLAYKLMTANTNNPPIPYGLNLMFLLHRQYRFNLIIELLDIKFIKPCT